MPLHRRLLLAAALLTASPLAAQNAKPIFENGQAQIVPAFADSSQWIREDLWVETTFDSDGDGKRDRMHVDVVRQRQTQTEGLKVAVVYNSSPYFSGTSGPRESLWNVRQEVGDVPPARTPTPSIPFRPRRPTISRAQVNTWVPRGFAVVHSEAPGTGLSQGCVNVGGPTEVNAPKAVIDWLNGRAKGYTSPDGNEEVKATWSTGKVGMIGTSYEGTLPVAAATTGVAGLEAIIPVAPNTSYYHYYRSNGLVRHPGGWLGEDIDFLWDFVNSGDPAKRDYCARTIRDGEMAAGRDRQTGDYNDYWAARDLLRDAHRIKAATLMAHAFNDWNVVPEHSVRIVEALKKNNVPLQMYFHQGGHGGEPPLERMNRWFTRYLYGIQNGVEQDPKAWIVREDADRQAPTAYADYPNPLAAHVTLLPEAGAAAVNGYNAPGTLVFSRTGAAGTEKLIDNVSFGGLMLAQAELTTHRLMYTTPDLKTPVHISGTARVRIRIASNKPAANLSVWLVALPGPQTRGAAQPTVITRGWADPQNHSSLTKGRPLVPGQFVDVRFDLQPDDEIIAAGKRIALLVFSSDRDFTLWPKPGTELTIDLQGTSLELPVVGGESALLAAFAPGARP